MPQRPSLLHVRNHIRPQPPHKHLLHPRIPLLLRMERPPDPPIPRPRTPTTQTIHRLPRLKVVVIDRVPRRLVHVHRAVFVRLWRHPFCGLGILAVVELEIPDPGVGAVPLVFEAGTRLAETVGVEGGGDLDVGDVAVGGWGVVADGGDL